MGTLNGNNLGISQIYRTNKKLIAGAPTKGSGGVG